MIRVSVLYPAKEKARFDWTYYLNQHVPLVGQRLGGAMKAITIEQGLAGGAPGSPPHYVAAAHLTFDSVEAFQAAIDPHRAELMGDVPNFSSIEPVIQVSEVKLAQ